jgi:acyl-CoA thioesterase FadM
VDPTPSVPTRFETRFSVRFDEAGPDGVLRSSGFLRYAQHAAWMHSTAAGFDRAWYAARGLTWLVRAALLRLTGRVPYGADLEVSTEVVGFGRAWARRRSEFGLEGMAVGSADIDWILIGPRGSPVRIPTEIDSAFAQGGQRASPTRVALPSPPAHAAVQHFGVRAHELDPMAHVNNAVYLDHLEEAVALAGGLADRTALPRAYQLEYALAAEPQARLEGICWRDAEGWAYLLRADGRDALRARLDRSPTPIPEG